MMSIYYMMLLKDKSNEAAVSQILDKFFSLDNGSDEEYRENIAQLQVIQLLGEDDIFSELEKDLLEDPRYKNILEKA